MPTIAAGFQPPPRQLNTLRAYLRKQQLVAGFPHIPAHPSLAIVVVIPCYDEPDLAGTLECLLGCQRPKGAVEVLLGLISEAERDS